jgi:hypothetical protein
MTTIEVIKTIKWLISVMPKPFSEFILSADSGTTEKMLSATYAWASIIPKLNSNEAAVAVLKAFGASAIADPASPENFAGAFLNAERIGRIHDFYSTVTSPFNRMTSTVSAWEQLTLPGELAGAEPLEDLFEFTLYGSNPVLLATLHEAFGHVLALYELLSEFLKIDAPNLEILLIQSGSPVQVNLKGSGELINYLKQMLAECWDRIRFKEAQKQIANNDAILSTLKVIEEVNKKTRSGALGPEEGEKLRRGLTKNMLGLINCHVLPSNITPIELIPNTHLLANFHPKLLADSSSIEIDAEAESSSPNKATRAHPAAKKAHRTKRIN